MKKLLYAALLLGAAMQFTACETDDSSDTSSVQYDLTKAMVINNEGNSGKENASISLYYANDDKIINDVYKQVNKEELGDCLQSITVANNSAYFMLTGSSKIVVANKFTCKKNVIIPVGKPRYMAVNGKTGYVSAWEKDEIAVIDLESNKITGSIKVGVEPEGILLYNDKLFVANTGEWGKDDNTISVINLKNNTVEKTLTVENNPKCLVLDKNNNIWVVCAGYATKGALCKINPNSYEVTKIAIEGFNPDRLQINNTKDKLYYGVTWGGAGIYQMDITATIAPATPFISGDFYGFNINPSNGEIIAMVADWVTAANNKMVRYSNTGSKIKEYTVGVGPNGGYFFN